MNITLKHINIYRHYDGDGDALVRLGTDEEKELMPYGLWKIMCDLIFSLELIDKGVASDTFKQQTFELLEEMCDNENTQQEFKKLARKN